MLPPRLAGLIALAVGVVVAAGLLLPHSPSSLRDLVLSAGVAAPVIAIAAWIVLTPALFPGTVLAGACGLAFGALGGALVAVVGAVAGGCTAFALARTAARSPVEQLIARRPRLRRVDALIERRGFAAILMARLMPGVPSVGLNYAAGVSPVPARAFAAAIALGALLRTVPYALLGEGLGSGSPASLLLAGASIALGALVAAVLVRHLRRSLPAPA